MDFSALEARINAEFISRMDAIDLYGTDSLMQSAAAMRSNPRWLNGIPRGELMAMPGRRAGRSRVAVDTEAYHSADSLAMLAYSMADVGAVSGLTAGRMRALAAEEFGNVIVVDSCPDGLYNDDEFAPAPRPVPRKKQNYYTERKPCAALPSTLISRLVKTRT